MMISDFNSSSEVYLVLKLIDDESRNVAVELIESF